jgi:hypothetical protein
MGIDLLPIVWGGVIGALIGGCYELLVRRRRPIVEAAALDPAELAALREQRRREVVPMMQRAGRAMAAYSHMIDAANLKDTAQLQRLLERLRAEEAEDGASDARPGDRRFAAAAVAFTALHDQLDAALQTAIEAARPIDAARELRRRAKELGKVVQDLNGAAARYVERG